MSEKHKKIISTGIVIAIMMGFFPPWVHTFKYKFAESEEPAGYAFILTPPNKKTESLAHGVQLDTPRLVVQWAVVAMAVGLALVLVPNRTYKQS